MTAPKPTLARRLPYGLLIPVAVLMALAPFGGQSHLIEKIGMLASGTLRRPIDIFDLVLHGTPTALVALRVSVDLIAWARRGRGPAGGNA